MSGVYPNPSTARTWTDADGTRWHRRGNRGQALDPKRTRTLVRRDGLLMAVWAVGNLTWFESSDDKQAAADALYDKARWADDILPIEWKSDDGEHMLMMEHHC